MTIISNSYRLKRGAAVVFSNAQSLRWVTEGVVLAKLWKGRISPDDHCLDAGCGGGSYAIENFLRAGARTALSDYDEGLLALAESQVRQTGCLDRASFVRASAEALPYADATFDRVQCIQVLEHLQHPETALREFHRVTKPGAILVVAVPHPPEWFDNPGHVIDGYSAGDFTCLIRNSGWEPEAVKPCMLLLSRLVICAMQWLPFPPPLNPLAMLERFVPPSLGWWCLPYVVVVRARRLDV